MKEERSTLATMRTGSMRSAQAVLLASALALTGCQQKMGDAPYYQPLEQNPFFADGRASRPLEAGTVSRGDLRDDDALYTGKVDGQLVEEFPISITEEVIA